MTRSDAELRRLDARARELAQTEFGRPLVLEAGAGTGKTTALVARVLAWSLGPGWERAQQALAETRPDRVARRVLSGVVAITFTEAAAAEMASRMGAALNEVERGERPLGVLESALPAPRRERARALRGALEHLVATTIHAWCRRLLVAHPLDADLHARLEIDADGRLGREVTREVLDARLRAGYADGDPRLFALAVRGVGPREIEREILALLDAGLPARAFAADPCSPERVGALGERLARAACAVRDAAAPLADSAAPLSVEACQLAARIAERLAEAPLRSRDALVGWVDWLAASLSENVQQRFREWGRAKHTARDAAVLGDASPRLADAARDLDVLLTHLRQQDVPRLDLGRAVFGELLGAVEEALRRRGIARFHDLIEAASRLVAGSPRVVAGLRGQIDQLLVDEFQDTDRRQCDLLRAVALGGSASSRPGLFVVGDPKQSIYGWRSADLSAYDAFVADVRAAGGERQLLYVNYRSVPAVLREVERVVAPVMQERPGVQPRFEPLVPSPENAERPGFTAAGHRPAEYWVAAACDPGPTKTRALEASKLEARALARELRRLHQEEGVAWKDFGVLFRTRSDWDVYLTALREHAVPFAVEGDRSYYRRREIVDAAAWVRAALDPNDHLALVTVLRSAAVGVPDAALLPLWAGELPRLLCELHAPDPEQLARIRACAEGAQLPADVPGLERVAGWELALAAAAEALAALRQSAREDPVDVFVEKLRTSLMLEASEAARFQGIWRAANLERFFRDLLADLEGGADFHQVLRRLRSAVADEEDAEEGRPREILGEAVQVLTIHGAKGLDFEHVYVMQLHKGPAPKRPAQVEWRSVGGELEYRLLGAPTPGFDQALREQSRVEDAERVRTLYVAMTRARARLVLSGLWPDFARAGSGRTIDLMADSLGEKGCEFPARLAELAARGEHAGLDAAGARWVLPALVPDSDVRGAGVAREAPALADEQTIAASSQRLAALRREMAARMARPFAAAASRDAAESPEERAERGWSRPERGFAAPRGDSAVAAAVGTALHRALEGLDLAAEPAAELERARALAARVLRSELSAAQLPQGLERLTAVFARFAAGPLPARLRALAPHLVARELPVLLAPAADDEAVGFVSGVLDLVYRDPESGRLVVADYKTGARGDYGAQGATYCRALREALRLDYAPRFELWYLEEGEIVAA